jgi:hypothetical protein
MYATTFSHHGQNTCDLGSIGTAPRSSLASRLPKRSLRQVYTIPLSDVDESAPLEWELDSNGDWLLSEDRPKVSVAAIPSLDGTCRHHLFVEDGAQLKKLDLPSTTCVAVSQQFEARAGDTLKYDYVVLLCSRGQFNADRPAIRAVLVDYNTGSAVSLMDRSIDAGCSTDRRRTGSRFRESQSYAIPATGQYELRFITFVDGNHPGSEAHLLVDTVRVENRAGHEVKRLASLSCVGRVRREIVD